MDNTLENGIAVDKGENATVIGGIETDKDAETVLRGSKMPLAGKTGIKALWANIKKMFLKNGTGVTVRTSSTGKPDVEIEGNDIKIKCGPHTEGDTDNDGNLFLLGGMDSMDANGIENHTLSVVSSDTLLTGVADKVARALKSWISFSKLKMDLFADEIESTARAITNRCNQLKVYTQTGASSILDIITNDMSFAFKGKKFRVQGESGVTSFIQVSTTDNENAEIKLRGSSTNNVTVSKDQNKIVGDTLFKDGDWSVSKTYAETVLNDDFVNNEENLKKWIDTANSTVSTTDLQFKILHIIEDKESNRRSIIMAVSHKKVSITNVKVYYGSYMIGVIPKSLFSLSGHAIIDVPFYVDNGGVWIYQVKKYKFIESNDVDYYTKSETDANALEIAVNISRGQIFNVMPLKGELKTGDKIRLYRNIRQRYRFLSVDGTTFVRATRRGWIAPKTGKQGNYIERPLSYAKHDGVVNSWADAGMYTYLLDNYCTFVSEGPNRDSVKLRGGISAKIARSGYTNDITIKYGVAVIRDGKVVSNIAPFRLKCNLEGAVNESNWKNTITIERA